MYPLVAGQLGGESGAEGVIPLTDSQAMETLGNAIGRYITIKCKYSSKYEWKNNIKRNSKR